jgi:glycosyltransferase involved in cell wall biosynthesis
MKILQVISTFAPAWGAGGGVRVSYDLSKALVKRGHQVNVVTTDILNSNERIQQKTATFEGINVWYFKNISNRLANKHCYFSFGLIGFLRDEIKNYDIVHIHEYRSLAAIMVHHYAMKYHIPYIISPHASTPRVSGKKFRKWMFDVVFGYRLIRDASHIIAGSQEEYPYDIQMGARIEQTSIIYPGMDLEKYRYIPGKGLFKKQLGIEGKIIIYIGRIHKQKGLDYCIQAFANLIEKYDNLFFVICGQDDGEKINLEKLINANKIGQNVIFTGFLQEDEKLSAYVDADIFIHTPVYMGGVGLTPLEAILCGTPVIVDDACGEVIKLAKCGYLVKYGDVNELKEKMIFALENPEYNNKLIDNGKRFIEKNLTWENVGEIIENLYKKSIQNEKDE